MSMKHERLKRAGKGGTVPGSVPGAVPRRTRRAAARAGHGSGGSGGGGVGGVGMGEQEKETLELELSLADAAMQPRSMFNTILWALVGRLGLGCTRASFVPSSSGDHGGQPNDQRTTTPTTSPTTSSHLTSRHFAGLSLGRVRGAVHPRAAGGD